MVKGGGGADKDASNRFTRTFRLPKRVIATIAILITGTVLGIFILWSIKQTNSTRWWTESFNTAPFHSCFQSLGLKAGSDDSNSTEFGLLLRNPIINPGTPLMLSSYDDRKDAVQVALRRFQICQMGEPHVKLSRFLPRTGPEFDPIPHIIHQSWKHADIPIWFKTWSDTWKKNHPEWTYMFWGDDDNRNLIATYYPEILWVYDALPHAITKADFSRLFYMHHYGGVYVDLDFESIKNMDHLYTNMSLVLARMGDDEYFEHSLPNAFMASSKGHPFWVELMKMVGVYAEMEKAKTYNNGVEGYAGPTAVFDAFHNYLFRADCTKLRRVKILEPDVMFPVDWKHGSEEIMKPCKWERGIEAETRCKNLVSTEKTVAITYWTHSWIARNNLSTLMEDSSINPGTPLILSGYNDRQEVVTLALKRLGVCHMSEPNVKDSRFLPRDGPEFGKIPKIIHQSWKRSTDLPENFARWQQTWKTNHPQWEYKFWSDDDNRDLVATHYPDILWIYDWLPRMIIKADFMRIVYMYHYGGVYVDMDFESTKPMDHLISNDSLILARMGGDLIFEDSLPNAFMASAPGHPFWMEMIKVVGTFVNMDKSGDFNVQTESYAGPRALFDAFHNYIFREECTILKRVKILDHDAIFPLDWRHAPHETLHQCRYEKGPEAESKCKDLVVTKNTVAITYWTHTW